MAAIKRHPKKTENNSLLIFLAIVILLVIISMLLSFFLTEDKNNNGQTPQSKTREQVTSGQANAVLPIEGTWVSNYDGAILTINGLNFTVEVPSVDATAKTEGKLSVEGNIVTFIDKTGQRGCQSIEGHYLYSFTDKGELFFKLIKDTCENRKDRMTMSWFNL